MEQFASLGSLHPLRSNEGVIGKCQCYAALSTLFDEPISHIWIGKINHDDACFSPWKACPSTPSRRFNRNRGSIIYCIVHFIQLIIVQMLRCIVSWTPWRRLFDWFALYELIAARRRLCKRFVLTRLMVGHTQEDIDSQVWNVVVKSNSIEVCIYTPQQYKAKIEKALSTNKTPRVL